MWQKGTKPRKDCAEDSVACLRAKPGNDIVVSHNIGAEAKPLTHCVALPDQTTRLPALLCIYAMGSERC
jgi:hypothetical protein